MINEFFNWLSINLPNIFDDISVQEELKKKLGELNPEIRWEIGPGESEANFLAFSPNLKFDLLDYTRMLVSKAPKIPGWEFLPAKPRKKWRDRRLKINLRGTYKEYDFNGWKYFLTSFNNGEFFDVNLVPELVGNIEDSDVQYAGELLVEFELGEELFLEIVDRVNIMKQSDEFESNDIKYLHNQILEELKRAKTEH